MMVLHFVLAAAAAAGAIDPASCRPFSPRAQNAPRSESRPGALWLAGGGKPYVYGGWRCQVEGIEGGAHYRFRARAMPRGVSSPQESLAVQLRWRGDFGEAVAPTFVSPVRQLSGAVEYDRLAEAPPKTRAVEIELVLRWSPAGEVAWQDIRFEPAPAPTPRRARVAAVWLRPRNSRNSADSVERFAEFVDRVAVEHHPDLILLGEMINRVGVKGEPEAQAELIPGGATERLAEKARRHQAYITFSLVERDGRDLFNTAVLLDRQGRVAGKYRKVQLPFEESSRGIAPGDSFPVFSTDFGRVGMMICHDASFPEIARELAINGAELILLPIWGGREALVHARAVENGVYIAASGYDYPSEIVDPLGRVLAQAKIGEPGVAVADVDLSRRHPQDWIGDWRETVNQQRRPSLFHR